MRMTDSSRGEVRPRSICEIVVRSRPLRSASSSCENPALRRAFRSNSPKASATSSLTGGSFPPCGGQSTVFSRGRKIDSTSIVVRHRKEGRVKKRGRFDSAGGSSAGPWSRRAHRRPLRRWRMKGGRGTPVHVADLLVLPLDVLIPDRARRYSELFLVWMLGRFIWFSWWERAQPLAAEFWLLSWAATLGLLDAVPVSEADEVEEEDDASISVSRAATTWFGQLELPSNQRELWGGPPLSERVAGATSNRSSRPPREGDVTSSPARQAEQGCRARGASEPAGRAPSVRSQAPRPGGSSSSGSAS